jgi:hypothetical protein
MKTQIIQLENHDDLISARDKMSWSKAPRILLVWPRKGRVLERPLDLISLQRYSQSLGSQLGIVSTNNDVRTNARELGIPIFSNPGMAQKFTWRRSRGRKRFNPRQMSHKVDINTLRGMQASLAPEKLESTWMRALAFSAGVLAVLVLMLFFLPSARLELAPQRSEQTLELDLRASPDITKVNPSGGMPAYAVSVVVEGSDQIPSSGSIAVPDTSATGEVEFNNLTADEVLIPAGTVVTTMDNPPLRFATSRDIHLPAGVGRKAAVIVQALKPGKSGNVAAAKIQAVEGGIGPLAGVYNPEAFAGGSDRTSPAPSEKDYTDLTNKLLGALRLTAAADLTHSLKGDQRLLDGTLQPGETVKKITDPQAGQPGDFARLTMQVQFNAWVVNETDLESVALTALDANRPQGFVPVSAKLSMDFLNDSYQLSEGTVHWKASVKRSLESNWDDAVAARSVVGMQPQQALHFLDTRFILSQPPRIVLSPSWWFRMPFLAFRIQVARQ